MEVDCIPFKETGYFSKLICDYLAQKEDLIPFFNRFPSLKNFEGQLKEKTSNYPASNRKILVDALNRQYKDFQISDATAEKITSLKHEKTFTVVTGHQLNLFTGPLYFLFKIISTINLTEQLKDRYPEHDFVPVYWMATEDHDFDEINYFNFNGQKVQWNKDAFGAVGSLSTEGLDSVMDTFASQIGNTDNANRLKSLFKRTYIEHSNLSDATRYLANELFGEYGLVIVDGDDTALKQLLVPFAKKDIIGHEPFHKVSESIDVLSTISSEYTIQVNPREINYFYLLDGIRERIVKKDENFYVNNTEIEFSQSELLEELEKHPERFSPNVIARPLYQEIILPNLCYIGGGGELAYWLELKSYFETMDVTFPMLLLRNSALLISEKQSKKIENLDLKVSDLFLKQNSFINKKIREISNIDIDFAPQKKHLEAQFQNLYQLAEQTDATFIGAVKAQEVKQKNGLDALEKRLLKAQKRKLKDHVVRMTDIQNELFPNASLQERQLNFSTLYLEFGEQLIPSLMESLDPLINKFLILKTS
ncbi:bacillithiol biosynthesis cysteine-adding enzyme BshC [Flagellimonas sp. HMM57]|uniref:bacillithiol biosynthesis cysteine-adding enzyme BshC n=1 Tax=unclassified Flagellimonas TaxID=2644544 RepID=UPI0013D645BC|nr:MULTISPECIES: bacillithiol biosynthesis cysteine-adding enzyme BshC [unclassified Flagellimonas]UII76386.1 bacillithiol biosynthesis cysteine-adding enzyme BshC [Flagellimonas sp. HMM57]